MNDMALERLSQVSVGNGRKVPKLGQEVTKRTSFEQGLCDILPGLPRSLEGF